MKDSIRIFARAFCVVFVSVAFFGGAVSWAYSPYSNPVGGVLNKALLGGSGLLFDPNDYAFLIYDCNGDQDSIEGAMAAIGLTYTLRSASNPVTLNDLNNHDLLIVGWAVGGDKTGLHTSIMEQGITGRVILSGHDPDYHTVHGPASKQPYAETFFIQEIDYVLQGSGTGMIVCADVDNNFEWLPESWGVQSELGAGSRVSSFTQDGLDSGIYDGLDPNDMSNWRQSYHNTFTSWGIGFEPFELGNDDQEVVTIGTPISAYGFDFEKNDDVAVGACLWPADEITYTICWENTSGLTFYEMVIIDNLPDGVTYPGGFATYDPNDPFNPIPPDPAYDPETHTYTWELGTVLPDEAGCAEITVMVNEKSEPGMPLYNVAKLVSDGIVLEWDSEETYVCCWDIVDPNIVYIDENATGNNNGTNWADAYTDLQRAIARATNSGCQVGAYTIYAAQGTYRPGDYVKDTFILPPNILMYGGFKTGGSPFDQRNPDRYKTTLTGYIALDENNHILRNETVVMMGHNTLLDGFIVTEGDLYGIYGEGVDFVIENCSISKNGEHGLYIEDGDVVLRWCNISNNTENGIRHIGAAYTLTLDNCQVIENNEYGIFIYNSTPVIRNSIISGNGFTDEGFFGIYILLPAEVPVLYNNTIAYNANAGLSWVDDFGSGSDPNELDYPDIQNCILWYNNNGGVQLAGYEFTQYSCVYDPNDSDGTDYTLDGFGNFSGNPGFAYEYSDDHNVLLNVHLAYDSPCIDMGNPNHDASDVGSYDMDAEDRIVDSRVDIGADEVYSCDDDLSEDDLYHSLDWTADGIVNFKEYAVFAGAWLSVDPNNPLCDPNNPGYVSDPNDPGYITEGDKLRFKPKCDLDIDLDVDLADLELFCDEWLWMACWKQSQMDSSIMMMAMGMGAGESAMMSVPMATTMSEDLTSTTVYDEPEPVFGSESDLARFVNGVNEIIGFVDRAITEDHPNSEALYEMKATLEEILMELRETILTQ